MRTYIRKTERGKISKDIYEKAVAVLQEDKTKKVRGVAKAFGMCHASLRKYLKKRKEAEEKGMAVEAVTVGYQRSRQAFSDEQEATLVSFYIQYREIYKNLTPKVMRQLAFACASKHNITMPQPWLKSKEAGPFWLNGFLKRNESLLKASPKVSPSTATSFNRTNNDNFFSKLSEVMQRYKFSSSRIWNVDEIGLTTIQKRRKTLLPKGSKQIGPIKAKERGSIVILCLAASAAGNSAPCMFVFPRIKYRNCFVHDGPEDCIGAGNSSDWMTETEFNIFIKHFIITVKPSPDDPVLLLLDNHSSHLDVEVVNTAKNNNVVLLSFPPDCSYRLQPLYIGVYGPFKNYYENQQDAWLRDNPGKTMTVHDIPSIVNKALPMALNPNNVINGFKKTGIAPFNDAIFQDIDFLSTFVTGRPFNDTADLYLENIAVDVQSTFLQIAETPLTPPLHSATQNTPCFNSIVTEYASQLRDINAKTENTYTFVGCSTYGNEVECNVSSRISQRSTKVAPEKNTLTVVQSEKKEKAIKEEKIGMQIRKTEESVFIKQENTSKREQSAEETGNIVIKREAIQEFVQNDEENDYLHPIGFEPFDLKEL